MKVSVERVRWIDISTQTNEDIAGIETPPVFITYGVKVLEYIYEGRKIIRYVSTYKLHNSDIEEIPTADYIDIPEGAIIETKEIDTIDDSELGGHLNDSK